MFREQINYCVTTTATSGNYSLMFQHNSADSVLILCFRSGNVFHQICLATAPRGMLLPREILALTSFFLSLFEVPPPCAAIVGAGEKLSAGLPSVLQGEMKTSIVYTFGPGELEQVLASPTAKIIERHDYRCILDFLLMKLRTALDQKWLQSLPTLYKVTFFLAL